MARAGFPAAQTAAEIRVKLSAQISVFDRFRIIISKLKMDIWARIITP